MGPVQEMSLSSSQATARPGAVGVWAQTDSVFCDRRPEQPLSETGDGAKGAQYHRRGQSRSGEWHKGGGFPSWQRAVGGGGKGSGNGGGGRAGSGTGPAASRRGSGAGETGWWGRIRLKAPVLSVFRPGGRDRNRRKSGTGGRGAEAGGGRAGRCVGGPGVSGFGGVPTDSTSSTCLVCDKAPSECWCHAVQMPPRTDFRRDPQRKPSLLRTESGKLKM